MLHRFFISLLVLAALIVPVRAVQPDEILADPALEKRARVLSAELRCLVCQNQSIDDSDAPLARDLRLLVRDQLKTGASDQAVLDHIVARYGEFVLLRPRWSARTWLLWLTPLLLMLGAAGFLYNRARAAAVPVAEPQATALSDEEQQRLKKILERG
ncbi:MAG: hypothetical protein RL291_159 [Pseudomonadota bacterium]